MCVGRVTGCYLFVQWWWTERLFFFFLQMFQTIDSAQRAERGSGLEKEVKLKGGVCRLHKGSGPKKKEEVKLGGELI